MLDGFELKFPGTKFSILRFFEQVKLPELIQTQYAPIKKELFIQM